MKIIIIWAFKCQIYSITINIDDILMTMIILF